MVSQGKNHNKMTHWKWTTSRISENKSENSRQKLQLIPDDSDDSAKIAVTHAEIFIFFNFQVIS